MPSKSAVLAIAIGAAMLFSIDAGAFPLTPSKPQPAADNHVTLVRDGCGPGRHYSGRRERCVRNRDDNPRYRRFSAASCKHECRERRADCNFRRRGYFNGCGVAYATCVAACDH
jgi:hypothetical protein